jgi:hypothetical protein
MPRNAPNILKTICEKPIHTIILNGRKLKTFSLKSGMTQEYLFSPFLFSIVLEFLGRAISQEKEIKGLQIERKTSNDPCLQMM